MLTDVKEHYNVPKVAYSLQQPIRPYDKVGHDLEYYHNGTWKSIHKHTSHGLAFCYDSSKVQIVESDYSIMFPDLEMFPVGVKVGEERIMFVLVYRPPDGSKRVFLHQLLSQLMSLPTQDYERLIVLGDFNLDQKSPEHIDSFAALMEHFNLIQRSTWSTHKFGGMLDLIFDNDKSKRPAEWMPSPYSDHFVLMFEL